MRKRMKIKTLIWSIIVIILYLLSVIINAVTDWFNVRFGVSFEEILFTITSPLEGSDVSFLGEAIDFVMVEVWAVIPILLIGIVISVIVLMLLGYVCAKVRVIIYKWSIVISFETIYKMGVLVMVLFLVISSVDYGFTSLDLGTYISRRVQKTTIYEDYYVNPKTAEISLIGEPKNIIYIYMESMETTYASIEEGGSQEGVNYIPHLTQLAKDNVSFSDTEMLGGGYCTTGTGWTMGALFGTTTGVPFSFPVQGNSMQFFDSFAPGITSLGDVLEEYGYKQIFLCGSDGVFAGRQAYFEQHGNYEVRDVFYARRKGYIPEDYWVWWGYEDAKLYEIAKKEIAEIAKSDIPFNYTMLTVDTHHVDGYICSNCQKNYNDQLGNVLQCADSQLHDFILWCQEQEFYEDTVIVITGDHFRMDSSLVSDKVRRMYNCIINSNTPVEGTAKNRWFTTLDLFPTTLSAMGFEIEGDRLGLGTDLFSSTPTLSEELGYDYFDAELGKYSDYYVNEFE